VNMSFIVGAAVGYVMGARAGRERYDTIVRVARKVAGSQTVQSAAGVLQAQVDELRSRAKEAVATRVQSGPTASRKAAASGSANGHRS